MTHQDLMALADALIKSGAHERYCLDVGTSQELTHAGKETEAIKAALSTALSEVFAERDALKADAERLATLRNLQGHWQDGSGETIKLFQDDATRTFHITVGKKSWWGNSFEAAIDAAKGAP